MSAFYSANKAPLAILVTAILSLIAGAITLSLVDKLKKDKTCSDVEKNLQKAAMYSSGIVVALSALTLIGAAVSMSSHPKGQQLRSNTARFFGVQ